MESISTKYLSSKLPLGNYAPFADIWIATGHDAKSVTNYRRALDCRTGLGSVSYSIGDGQFKREVFCSFPHDNVAIFLVISTLAMRVNSSDFTLSDEINNLLWATFWLTIILQFFYALFKDCVGAHDTRLKTRH